MPVTQNERDTRQAQEEEARAAKNVPFNIKPVPR